MFGSNIDVLRVHSAVFAKPLQVTSLQLCDWLTHPRFGFLGNHFSINMPRDFKYSGLCFLSDTKV